MKKKASEIAYFCQRCGHSEKKWHGRCPACQEWNSMVEERLALGRSTAAEGPIDSPQPITAIGDRAYVRRTTGIDELDRVLGGGLVAGSVSLIGGEPGAGKSTLLQMASFKLA